MKDVKMFPFEIHLTYNPQVTDFELLKNFCDMKGMKLYEFEIPNCRNDYITALKVERETLCEAVNLANNLADEFYSQSRTDCDRIKVETVPQVKDLIKISQKRKGIYHFEAHFDLEEDNECPWGLKYSYNKTSNKRIATLRMYDVSLEVFKEGYDSFRMILENSNSHIEFCAYDTNPNHDYKWLATS